MIVLGAALVALLMGFIERRWPARPGQRWWRHGVATDLAYWVFTPLVTRTLVGIAMALAVVQLAVLRGLRLEPGDGIGALVADSWVSAHPMWLQVVEVLLMLDLLGYVTHRWFHRDELWRFHAIHHSPEQLDWISAARNHPINRLLGGLLHAVPLLALGFDPRVLAGAMPAFGLYGLLLHANVRWDFGPLRYVVASPRFHRWHHSGEAEGRDCNFAGLFPFIDLAFGTFHLPDRDPARFGVDDDVPEGLWAQLRWPFQGSGSDTRSDRSPTGTR